MSAHAPIAPSALDITVACPASVKLQASVPVLPETEEEAEGIAAHWVAMRYAAGYGSELPVDAKFISNNREWTVDLDMVTGAMMYAYACGGCHPDLRLEDAVAIPQIHDQCWGTPDAWRYFPSYVFPPTNTVNLPTRPIKLVRVPDYKYGHRFVEVYGRYQLIAYFFGVLNRLNIDFLEPDLWVEFIIVQPRSYHRDGPVRIWRVPAAVLNAPLIVMQKAALEAFSENLVARTSEHCIDCKARHVCVTYQRLAQTIIDFSSTAETVELPPQAIGQELALVQEAMQRLEGREKGLAAQAEALLRQGKSVPLYHMESGQSRAIYRDDVNIDEVVGLGDILGIDLRKPQTKKDMLVTPTQAVQMGVDEAIIKKYSHRPPAALKLARDNSIIARKVFSK